MQPYFTINTCSELICFFVATICLYKDKSPAWKWLAFYMLLVCVTEFCGVYIKNQDKHNSWVYNILLFFEIGTVLIMLQTIAGKYIKNKTMVIGSAIVLATIYVYDLSLHGIFKRNYYTNIALAIAAVILSLYYFYSLLKDEEYINLKYSAAFWWVFGTFFYYFVDTTLNVFYPVLSKMLIAPNDTFAYIYKAANLILYGCWSYSFICKRTHPITSKS